MISDSPQVPTNSARSLPRRAAVAPQSDAYGQEIWNCYKGIASYEIVEREDGFIDLGTALPYFAAYENWPAPEREALQRARGPILDVGCGAGRVALHLQDRGHRVLAIDNSPLAVKVSKLRGVKSARILPIEEIRTLRERFATIVMYGCNFGLFGGLTKARRLLAAMHRITTPEALILAATANPYVTRDPVHLSYHQWNRERGRMGGQIRLRIRYRQIRGRWFDYLFASPDEVRSILENTGWCIDEIVPSQGAGYVAILKKS